MSEALIPRDFGRHPMLVLAIYYALGIAIAFLGSTGAIAAAASAALLLAFAALKRSTAAFIVPLFFIPLGVVCFEIERRSVGDSRIKTIYADKQIESWEPVEIEGVLLSPPEPAYGGLFLKVRAERLWFKGGERPASGTVRLFAVTDGSTAANEYSLLDLHYGSVVKVACRLEREERFLNPGVASRTQLLDQQGVDAVGTLKSPLLIEKRGEERVFLPLAWAFEQRQRLIGAFREAFSSITEGVMIASLLGDAHFLDRQTAEVFREGGTFHVLVISGLHITFMGALTLWALSFITRHLLWQSILASAFLWGYTFAVGAETPVIRASLMFSVLLVSRVIYRDASLLNAFGACTLLILVWRPSDLFSVSFQLTVVSVAAIAGCAFPLIEKLRAIGSWTPTASTPLPPNVSTGLRRWCELLYWNQPAWTIENSRQIWSANLFKAPYFGLVGAPNLKTVLSYLFEGVLVSAVVQIWMLPLVVIYFHRISPAGVLLNIWVGVFLALESFSAIGALAVNTFNAWLAAPLVNLTELLNLLMMSLPTWFSASEISGFRMPVYSGASQAIYYLYGAVVAITAVQLFAWDPFSFARANHLRRKLFSVIQITLGVVIVFHPFSSPRADGKLRIDFLDVGQGDAALITFPTGETMLVDGGGRVDYRNADSSAFEPDVPRIGEMVVSEFLWEKGYSRIDRVLATHADADHVQGLTDVIENFDVGELLVGDKPFNDADFDGVRAVAERHGVPVVTVHRGDELTVGNVRISVLNPEPSTLRESSNDRSVVLAIEFGERKFLLTGDIERETETELITIYGFHLASDVVKVPHHGSRTSSTQAFVDRVRATTAVVSIGRRSRFGHPHSEVVERWKESGAEVLTTGARGTVTVETDGGDIEVRTFRP